MSHCVYQHISPLYQTEATHKDIPEQETQQKWGSQSKNTFGLKSSLSLVPATIHFLSGETRSMLTLKVSHTITLDILVNAESASVHTDPWLVPTWKIMRSQWNFCYHSNLNFTLRSLTVRNQLLFTLYCSNVQCGDAVEKEATSWPLWPCQVLIRPVESAVITTSRFSSCVIPVKGLCTGLHHRSSPWEKIQQSARYMIH